MSEKLTVIGGKESLVERVGELLLKSKAPEKSLVVFPGKRPAHFLRKYIADRMGRASMAPTILSMDSFIDLIYSELCGARSCATALDLADILYGSLKKELCSVISRDPGELTLDSFLPWALKLTGDFEELKIELKTQKDLSGYDALLPEDLRSASFIRKLESFSRLYGGFYAALEKEKLVTRSIKYSEAAKAIERFDAGRYEHIIFAGFFGLTGAEKKILKHLSGRGAHILLEPGPGLEEQFSFIGKLPAVAAAHAPKAELHFYKASDTHGEIFKLARTLKAPAYGDVIVLPEARTLFPLMENVLAGAGDYNISMGYPLASTPVYALLDSLGDLLDKKNEAGYFIPNYLKFVFHPYVKNCYLKDSAEPSRVIFQTIEERLSSRVNKYITLKELEDDITLLEDAAARLQDYGGHLAPEDIKAHIAAVHRTLISPFEEIKDIGDFAVKLLAFISYISDNSTASLHPYWAPFAGRAIEHITELKNSRLAGGNVGGAAGYFKFFKTFISGANYPFPGTPLKGLQVLGLLETRNLKFDRVYFLDANSDILPATRKEDTVLSHFVREALGLSTYKSRERLARYYFNALLAGAREAHIFYKDNAAKERSPFVEKIIWDLERAGVKPKEEDVHLRIKFAQAEPIPAAKTKEMLAALKNRAFSPSAIDTYLGCGLKFYYKYVLRLAEKDVISDEVEQKDIGVMVHAILQDFFLARKNAPLAVNEKDRALMRETAEKIFNKNLKGHDSGYEYIIKRQIERRLAEVLDYHARNLSGVTILDCEVELKTQVATKYGDIKLKGRADRVDERSGTVHILDYKTGAASSVPNWQSFDYGLRETWPKTLRSVQLPFYVLAYMAEERGRKIEKMDASLMILGQEEIKEESLFRERRGKTPDKAQIFSVYERTIVTLIEEILDMDRPFEAASEESACANCSFKNLCGRQWL